MTVDKIFVEKIKGVGSLNFVLVHNAGGDHHFFNHQIDALKKQGDVILLDLPGHGASSPRTDNSIKGSSLVISEICQSYSLKDICFIGLNNGADIVLNTVYQHQLPVNSLILIDPPLFMDNHFVAEINNFIECLEGEKHNEFIHSLVNNLFIETYESNKQIALNAFMSVDRNTLQDMFRSLIDWNQRSENIVKTIDYSTLFILTDEHHCSYSKIKNIAPKFEIGKVIGSKCWATLEVPEQINAMIERFLNIQKSKT